MQQVRLGRSGLHVSRVCLGMMSYGSSAWRPWVLDEDAPAPIVRAAVEAGINFFDTADIYSDGASEVVTGRLLRAAPVARRGRDRDQGVQPDDTRPERARASRASTSCRRSTHRSTRLGMDYVDLYQIHRFDPLTPVEETMEALHDVVRAGKARYIGASSMFAWQFAKLQHAAERHGWTRFVSMQNHYNLLYREEEREMIPLCHDQGVGVMPWSPLARGLLAGTRTRTRRAPERARRDRRLPGRAVRTRPRTSTWSTRVAEVAAARGAAAGAGRARVAAAQARRRCRSSARRGEGHIADARAATELGLSDEEIASLEAPYVPTPCGATIDALAPGARYERIDMLSYQSASTGFRSCRRCACSTRAPASCR